MARTPLAAFFNSPINTNVDSSPCRPCMNEWKLTFDHWDIKDQKAREALCTLGNGYWATRGAFEEATQHDGHYPGTYVAGVYDRCERIIAGETVSHETIVNWPNWLYLTFAMDNGQWFSMEQVQVNTYRQELDLQRGVLSRYIHFSEPKGRETILQAIRLVHMEHPHLATLQWTFTPLNWSGRLHVRSALDSGISNENVDRYREMNTKHYRLLDSGFHRGTIDRPCRLQCTTGNRPSPLAGNGCRCIHHPKHKEPSHRCVSHHCSTKRTKRDYVGSECQWHLVQRG